MPWEDPESDLSVLDHTWLLSVPGRERISICISLARFQPTLTSLKSFYGSEIWEGDHYLHLTDGETEVWGRAVSCQGVTVS